VTNEKRLAIALENCLRDTPADQLKEHCSKVIDELVRSLPKERGGSKVQFEGRTRGRATAAPTAPSPQPRKAVASLGVRKDTP